jgi:hypothetical protein
MPAQPVPEHSAISAGRPARWADPGSSILCGVLEVASVGDGAQVGVPHRGRGVDVDSLPPDYQRLLALVRGASGRSWSSRSARN